MILLCCFETGFFGETRAFKLSELLINTIKLPITANEQLENSECTNRKQLKFSYLTTRN